MQAQQGSPKLRRKDPVNYETMESPPIDYTPFLALLAIEASYQLNHEAFARQAVFITRKEFHAMHGPLMVTGEGLQRLFELGVRGVVWQPMMRVPVGKPPGLVLNGRQ